VTFLDQQTGDAVANELSVLGSKWT